MQSYRQPYNKSNMLNKDNNISACCNSDEQINSTKSFTEMAIHSIQILLERAYNNIHYKQFNGF